VTSFTTPLKLRSANNMGTSKGSNSSTQGVYESFRQYYSPADLLKFQTEFGIDPQTVSTVIGGHESSSVCSSNPETCSQANLDVQYIMAASPVSPTTFWYTDLDYLSQWMVLVANTAKPSLVYSISYYMEEAYTSNSERLAFETQAIKLGAMGVTIVAASGDDGALPNKVREGGACSSAPLFPASSPYVTTVGATMVSIHVW
jgi:subtilase family serine protease